MAESRMDERLPSRRQFLGASLLAVPGLYPPGTSAQSPPEKPLSVVSVGGHPDDPESGCGGALVRYAAAGHRVTIIYLTRGERGISGKALDEAARIRTGEAERACGILGAAAKFAGQIDGATEVTAAAIERLVSLVRAEAPDVVFTHWPIDSHPDHQAASLLTMRAWYALKQAFPVYFFEVDAGAQTIGFRPTTYVDITAVRDTKKRALFAQESQHGNAIYRDYHEPMESFRGREIGVAAAEAFIALDRSGVLPSRR
jgi:LmbE family N-acetylglucosaminyl deacetylase